MESFNVVEKMLRRLRSWSLPDTEGDVEKVLSRCGYNKKTLEIVETPIPELFWFSLLKVVII